MMSIKKTEKKKKSKQLMLHSEPWPGPSGFGGADVACWPLIPKFAGSHPAEAVGFLKGDKNPQHAFLRKGSKIIGPMSQICGM